MSTPKKSGKAERTCTWCGEAATRQTGKGESNEQRGGHPRDDGWFCDECWRKGDELEQEAMYG